MSELSDSVTRVLDEKAMTDLAASLAPSLSLPLSIYLEGDLGAGKTTFVRALIQAMGYEGRVKSPTYGILEHYEIKETKVLHLDLYRIGDPGELEFLGITDLYDDHTLLLVEWPKDASSFLPKADIRLFFDHQDGGRTLKCKAYSSSGNALCDSFHRLL